MAMSRGKQICLAGKADIVPCSSIEQVGLAIWRKVTQLAGFPQNDLTYVCSSGVTLTLDTHD
jgi:hypothetical protein